jgi:hypothetical protein
VENLEPSVALAGNYIDDTNAAMALEALQAEAGGSSVRGAQGAALSVKDGGSEGEDGGGGRHGGKRGDGGSGGKGGGRCAALINTLERFVTTASKQQEQQEVEGGEEKQIGDASEWKWGEWEAGHGSGHDQRRFMTWSEFKRGRSSLQPFTFDAKVIVGSGAGIGADVSAEGYSARLGSVARFERAAEAAMGKAGGGSNNKTKLLLLLGANPPACPGCVVLAHLLQGRAGEEGYLAELSAILASKYSVLLVNMELASDRLALRQAMPSLVDQWQQTQAALLVVATVEAAEGGEGYRYRPEAASDLRNLLVKKREGEGGIAGTEAKTSCSQKLPHMCFALGAREELGTTFDRQELRRFLLRKQ